MTLYDLIETSVGNLWRSKLRAFLTISGVIIAIAAFVALLSFGAGNQKYITNLYTEFGLFTSMHVYPGESDENNASAEGRILDDAAIRQLAEIPGVNLAYPYETFEITAYIADTHFTTKARVLPTQAVGTRLFSRMLGGKMFSSDSAGEAFITHEFLEKIGCDNPDSLIGRDLIISAQAPSLDSAIINIFKTEEGAFRERFENIKIDSLSHLNYRRRIMQQELNEGLKRFIEGFMERQLVVYDTLRILGVGEPVESYRISLAPVIIPRGTAHLLNAGGFGLGSNPMDLYEVARSGRLFNQEGNHDSRSYPRVFLDLDPYTPYEKVKDSVKALGFEAFSFAEQFKEMQRFFLYYNLGLAIIGLIALATASLGIINTMVMSIIERRREIGVIKSLGADEADIRIMFLSESAMIGAIGSTLGIICGWIGTRIVSMIMQAIMSKEGMPVFDPFAMPLWLILLAFAFGVVVSLLAGLYPAARAAHVDPVLALRNE